MTGEGSPGIDSLRVDKWLWHARFFKTRSLAAKLVSAGKVRVTVGDASPARITKPSHGVRTGDVLTFPQGAAIRVVRIEALGTRRGPAVEAQGLYADLSPPRPRAARTEDEAAAPAREPGQGRPTKKERRELDRFRRQDPS